MFESGGGEKVEISDMNSWTCLCIMLGCPSKSVVIRRTSPYSGAKAISRCFALETGPYLPSFLEIAETCCFLISNRVCSRPLTNSVQLLRASESRWILAQYVEPTCWGTHWHFLS